MIESQADTPTRTGHTYPLAPGSAGGRWKPHPALIVTGHRNAGHEGADWHGVTWKACDRTPNPRQSRGLGDKHLDR